MSVAAAETQAAAVNPELSKAAAARAAIVAMPSWEAALRTAT
jgi:hypothetical protein